jgi:hypothetical protein
VRELLLRHGFADAGDGLLVRGLAAAAAAGPEQIELVLPEGIVSVPEAVAVGEERRCVASPN